MATMYTYIIIFNKALHNQYHFYNKVFFVLPLTDVSCVIRLLFAQHYNTVPANKKHYTYTNTAERKYCRPYSLKWLKTTLRSVFGSLLQGGALISNNINRRIIMA